MEANTDDDNRWKVWILFLRSLEADVTAQRKDCEREMMAVGMVIRGHSITHSTDIC